MLGSSQWRHTANHNYIQQYGTKNGRERKMKRKIGVDRREQNNKKKHSVFCYQAQQQLNRKTEKNNNNKVRDFCLLICSRGRFPSYCAYHQLRPHASSDVQRKKPPSGAMKPKHRQHLHNLAAAHFDNVGQHKKKHGCWRWCDVVDNNKKCFKQTPQLSFVLLSI